MVSFLTRYPSSCSDVTSTGRVTVHLREALFACEVIAQITRSCVFQLKRTVLHDRLERNPGRHCYPDDFLPLTHGPNDGHVNLASFTSFT